MQNEQSLKGWLKGSSRERQSIPVRLFLGAMSRLRQGGIEIQLPGGARHVVGQAEGETGAMPFARWIIRDEHAIGRIIRRGDLGFAEGYMEGEWDTPQLLDLLMVLDANREQLQGVEAGKWLARIADTIYHWTRRNSKSRSRENISYHYDLGNDFYRLWLDETMTYSAAIFGNEHDTLEKAQLEKYRRLREPLNLDVDSHLLEIGSGWGGFAIEAVKATGCRVTSITLSREQLEEARARAESAGVADRIDFRLQDYRDLEGRFDAIASCEMFEAVGEEYWPAYFNCIRERLKPGGRAALQVITIDNHDFENYRRGVDFIQRYIFPGGMLPSAEVFDSVSGRAGLLRVQREFHGEDYAETLARWDRRVLTARTQIERLGFDNRFMRMWHYYLKYCETGFRNKRTDVMQVVLEHADTGRKTSGN